MNTSRRWPPQGSGHHAPQEPPGNAELAAAIGDLTRSIMRLGPPTGVLGQATYAFGGSGPVSDGYPLPYAALAITNLSATQTVTIANAPPQQSAPGPGPGSVILPPMSFRVVNMASRTWTAYGGSPGDMLTVEAFTRPMQPAAAILK